MKSIKVGAFIVAAWAVAVVSLALAHAQGSSTGYATAGDGTAAQRSAAAGEAEAQIASTNLAGRMTAALGDGFGGVWFEPSTARLHVGVTSDAGARLVEAVAASAGHSEIVAPTPVASTWAELEAEQLRWNRRVADLLGRGEASTALAPDTNSVAIELGPSVAPPRRTELERAADGASVEVTIESRPGPPPPGGKGLQCLKWAEFKAFCDPTMVAGVTFDSEFNAQETRETCTTGPTAILANRGTKETATKTYVLTAGHCIDGAGGEGKKWYAYNKEGELKGEKEVGTAGPFLNAETDVGAVLIDKSKDYWAKDNNIIPVVPTVARWSKGEHDPTVVKTQIPPVKNTKTCFSGQRSGELCGTIENASMTYKFPGEPVATERLAEVKLAGGKQGGEGDSGGPFFSEATPSSVEGTFVGYSGGEPGSGEGPIVYFHSLETSFATLGKEKAFTLELLTEANQKRHPKLKAGKYPVTLHGGVAGGTEKFAIEGGAVECKKTSHHFVVTEETPTWTDTAKYEQCTMFGFEGATVDMEGCSFEFHLTEKVSTDNYKAHVDVVCPTGKSIKMAAGTCKIGIKAQTGLTAVDVIDDTSASPKKDVTLRPTVTGLAYTVTEDGCVCPFTGTGNKTGGEYVSTENITVTGQSTITPSEKIDVEVAGE